MKEEGPDHDHDPDPGQDHDRDLDLPHKAEMVTWTPSSVQLHVAQNKTMMIPRGPALLPGHLVQLITAPDLRALLKEIVRKMKINFNILI